MKERPILFKGPMVQAILDGRKTQTRRLINPQPRESFVQLERRAGRLVAIPYSRAAHQMWNEGKYIPCPFTNREPEDRLWVRETWAYAADYPHGETDVVHAAGWEGFVEPEWSQKHPAGAKPRWRPSIHMPRWASRINLEVTGIRVERLRDITEADAKAEGISTSVVDPWPREPINAKRYAQATDAFADLWRSINGLESWDANPWVWVVGFKRLGGAT